MVLAIGVFDIFFYTQVQPWIARNTVHNKQIILLIYKG